jgi:hypothetical protein
VHLFQHQKAEQAQIKQNHWISKINNIQRLKIKSLPHHVNFSMSGANQNFVLVFQAI